MKTLTNPFQIGPQVFGDSFIGREEILKKLRKSVIENPTNRSISLVGLTRIGKSSIAKNLLVNLPNNTISIYVDVSEWGCFLELIQDIIYKTLREIKNKSDSLDIFNNIFDEIQKDNIPWIKINRLFKEFFDELSLLGIKLILVLDEFDSASKIFLETKHFELFRILLSESRFNVSAILISRRHLISIEGATYQSSTFHGVVDTMYIKGFNDDDLKAYYELFEIFDINLTQDQKSKIEFYAGNSPYLLSILGYNIIESKENNELLDIDEIFARKCKAINDYYRDCIQHLKRDDKLKTIIPFIIGPNIGVTQKDKEELINLGYLSVNDENGLMPISQYFVSFLTNELSDKISIWDNIINLEKRIKLLIDSEMLLLITHFEAAGKDLTEIEKNILLKMPKLIKGKEVEKYDSFIIQTKKQFNRNCRYLDVLSLNDCFKIIYECWGDIFSKYFNNDLLTEWSSKFDKCAKARNPVAHGHEEYINENDQIEIDVYCKQIMECLSKIKKSFSEQDLFKQSSLFLKPFPEFIQPDNKLKGSIVKCHVIKRSGTKYSNLQGIVQNNYKGIIPEKYLMDKDILKMIGQELYCKVEQINNDVYILKPMPSNYN